MLTLDKLQNILMASNLLVPLNVEIKMNNVFIKSEQIGL